MTMESAIHLSPLALEAGFKLSSAAMMVWMDVQRQLLESTAKSPNTVVITDLKLATVLQKFGLIKPVTYTGVVVPTKWRVPREIAFVSREPTLKALHDKAEAADMIILSSTAAVK